MCIDEMKIIRQWFKDYHKWKIKAARLKPRQRAIRITGLPKSKPADPDSKMIQYTNATNECQQRLDLLKMMIDTEKNGKLYADIIEKRYLRVPEFFYGYGKGRTQNESARLCNRKVSLRKR